MRRASARPTGTVDALTIPEIVERARRDLPGEVWDYSSGGAESETTLRRNRTAFSGLAFRPRVLRGLGPPDLTTSLLGEDLALPVLLAPVGSIATFHPDGALACARVAEAAGTAAFVGTLSHPSLEVVRAGSRAPLYFQVYVYGDREWLRGLIERVQGAGYQALCLTVDVAGYGRRERDLHNRYFPRQSVERPNLGTTTAAPELVNRDEYNAAFSWQDVEWIRSVTSLPIMLKGVLDGADAELAVEHGVDVVYVSNHGGRQLDHAPASVEVLPEVVAAVAGRAQIVVDSGIVRGTDVVKCLALGATAVSIGKLMCWGLAAGGEQALSRTLELLAAEITGTLSNIGVAGVGGLTPDVLRTSAAEAGTQWPACL